MTTHWKAAEQYFTVTVTIILENLSVLDFALSGMQGSRSAVQDLRVYLRLFSSILMSLTVPVCTYAGVQKGTNQIDGRHPSKMLQSYLSGTRDRGLDPGGRLGPREEVTLPIGLWHRNRR